ncbi:alpha/beta hydrolase [Pedobacter sp. SAFR-022]|uniref:alpha/beta hydrolase n=1 Tax=Pedobacter sp. SAFR-022 TaxID=3436861 RepID=UPI003F7EDBC4
MKLLCSVLLLSLLNISTCILASAQNNDSLGSDQKFVLGKVEVLHSSILSENRILNVYLPEGYDSTARYPIIYLLDGSADEDFIHVAGIVQFNTFPWVNRLPKSIVIGIANINRKYDFTSKSDRSSDNKLVPRNGGSTRFISFIEQELQPYVEKKYGSSEGNTIIGQSLGGLLATEILFTKPQLFDKYIIISPSLWWRDGYLLRSSPSILNSNYSAPTKIYIGVGKEGSIDGSKEHIMEEDARLLADKLQKGLSRHVNVYFDYLPEEDHSTITHQAVFNAFRMLYPKQK